MMAAAALWVHYNAEQEYKGEETTFGGFCTWLKQHKLEAVLVGIGSGYVFFGGKASLNFSSNDDSLSSTWSSRSLFIPKR